MEEKDGKFDSNKKISVPEMLSHISLIVGKHAQAMERLRDGVSVLTKKINQLEEKVLGVAMKSDEIEKYYKKERGDL